MNKDWILSITAILTLITGYFAGQRGRLNALATTVEKEWLKTVAEDLAEFVELQIDIIWKRWRINVIDDANQTNSQSYEKEAFRSLQAAAWQQTFRSDTLKSKLLLMLDDRDRLQGELIAEIENYAKHVPDLAHRIENLEKNVPKKLREQKLLEVVEETDVLLRERRPLILDAGRLVLADKRKKIRRSI